MKPAIYIVLFVLTALGCNPESNTDEVLPVAVYTVDFSTVIEENPSNNKLLGFVYATTNIGTVSYSVFSESHEGAFSIESDTGKLRAANPAVFDYETAPIVTGVIAVTNADVTEYLNVTVELLDVFIENERRLTNLDRVGAFSGPLFCDTTNSFEFNGANLERWFTLYSNSSFNDEIDSAGDKISSYSLSFESPGSPFNEYYTFQYNDFGLVNHIQLIREDPSVPGTETFNYSITYSNLDGFLLNENTGETITIKFDIERFIRRVESNTKWLEYDYDYDNNLISKLDHSGNTVTYTYDAKRNPFPSIASYNFGQIRALINILQFDENDFLMSSPRNNGIWQSSNNIIAIDAINCDGECIESVSYSYEYNSDGYPTSKTRDGNSGFSIQYSYQ